MPNEQLRLLENHRWRLCQSRFEVKFFPGPRRPNCWNGRDNRNPFDLAGALGGVDHRRHVELAQAYRTAPAHRDLQSHDFSSALEDTLYPDSACGVAGDRRTRSLEHFRRPI